MSDPAISIIIPVHNAMPYVKSTIFSAQRQGLKNMEIIVVDDCSTDGSLETACGLAEDDERLCYFRLTENRGAGAARNEGLRQARGEYVHFLDSDDVYYRKDSLKTVVDVARRNRSDVLMFEHLLFDKVNMTGRPPITREERRYWKGRKTDDREFFSIGEDPALLLLPAYPWNKLYRREFLLENGILCSETKVHNDLALVWQAFLAAERISLLPEAHVVHQYAPGVSQLSNDRSRSRFDVFTALEDVDRFVLRDGTEEYIRPWYSKFKVDTLCFGLGRIGGEHRAEFARRCREALRPSRVREIWEIRGQVPTWKSSIVKTVLVKYFPLLASVAVRTYHRLRMRQLYRRSL